MTATPRLYDEGSKTKAAENTAVLASMDDESLYGAEFHRLGFGDAVEANLLSDYKVLVLAVLIVLVDRGVFPGWMVAAIVAREFLVSGLRLAAIERGIVLGARDLGKLKTWSQALAAAAGGLAAAEVWRTEVAWWALVVALLLTWVSGLDYARAAPRLLRRGAVA